MTCDKWMNSNCSCLSLRNSPMSFGISNRLTRPGAHPQVLFMSYAEVRPVNFLVA
jgi:hypothetical protein